ncbi:hypothetical protein PVAND_006445 [Polypedilum vanderplanki]|uniref:LITAF domain-containing protein n=1 Tax=Polypedilum vanderplanki TaxID=319348 RepID=A0A9J6C383_POLVA|nr:hypothetical protein PVAND_006445 [Polypedilum vanderplanki]
MNNPPSYNEAMNAPSAPPIDQNFMQQQHNWNQPTYPPHQPLIHQQPQIYQPPPQQTVIVINQHIQFSENPVSMICYQCNQQILTKTSYENNVINHMLAGILCFMGLWCGCFLVPYCIDSIKDVKHQCPKCNNFLGLYRRGRRF